MEHGTSLPSWECGLKLLSMSHSKQCVHVAPFVGVWIEIIYVESITLCEQTVAPFVGVWIEI